MHNIFKLNVVAAIIMLSACQKAEDPTAGKLLADIPNADLVRLCERADLQDVVLNYFVEAVFKRNVANAGLLGSLYDQGLSEEKIRQQTSIENVRAERHSTEQVDCTADFVSDVSSEDVGFGEVKFADAQYALIQQPDNSYQVVPKKASFFANIFLDGVGRDIWIAERRRTEQSAQEAEGAASSPDGRNAQGADDTGNLYNSQSRAPTAEEEADIRRIAEEAGMKATPHGNGFDIVSSDDE
jgi:hypothetical protein